jgi:oligopeptidase B
MRRLIALFGCLTLTFACSTPDPAALAPAPPIAKVEPTRLEKHGHARVDDYYWLKERENPEVIAYLEAENAYTRAMLAHTEELQETLFEEIVARIPERDASVPYRKGDYYYYHRYVEGGEYPLYCRKKGSLDAEEEVLIDGNREAEGHQFWALRGFAPSPDHTKLAYAVDTVGRRLYTLRFRDLATGADLAEEVADITGNHAWAADSATIFYTRQHPETLRWHQIYRHEMGTDPAADVLVYEEADEEFSSYVYKTKSERYLVIGSDQTLSTEARFLDAAQPEGAFQVFLPREENHEYSIDHVGDRFYLRTNWQATNFRLMTAREDATAKENWIETVPHREDTLLASFELFDNHLVVSERSQGLIHLRIRRLSDGKEHDLDFGEPAYLAYVGDNPEPGTTILRFEYTSLTTPDSVFDYDMESRERTLLKEEPVLGGFDKQDYVTERLWATAGDGVQVPISIVYRRGFPRDGSRPLWLYGYGSYGSSTNASFRSSRLSLVDRGFAFAIAHIRGGQEMGRQWYEDGKLLKKMNTFTDFVDCGRFLVEQGYTSPDRLFAEGGSAGGLLMGAVTNLAPELFRGVVSHVPFVDVVTTMLDSDIPLTTSEYDEWGDPNVREYYDYMLSYSPYDNLAAKAYPALLVTTGLHDSQVQYWEPAKYVARLRTLKQDTYPLLLHTNMEAGHGGATGRFKRHRETALAYAFALDQIGVTE